MVSAGKLQRVFILLSDGKHSNYIIEVKAGGHGSQKSKRKGPPRVDKRASKRGEHSEFQSRNDTTLGILHMFISCDTHFKVVWTHTHVAADKLLEISVVRRVLRWGYSSVFLMIFLP